MNEKRIYRKVHLISPNGQTTLIGQNDYYRLLGPCMDELKEKGIATGSVLIALSKLQRFSPEDLPTHTRRTVDSTERFFSGYHIWDFSDGGRILYKFGKRRISVWIGHQDAVFDTPLI